jgi:hypothetical protein
VAAVLQMAQTGTGFHLPLHFIERVLTAAGLIASTSALLSFMACALAWIAPCEFLSLWSGLCIAGLGAGPHILRALGPLFWAPADQLHARKHRP